MSDLPVTSLVNGAPQDQLSIRDRGLAYGDGLFETLRLHRGEPEHWILHWQRLIEGCRRLQIPTDRLPEGQVRQEIARLIALNGATSGVIKLIVTRGEGGRGYRFTSDLVPNRVITLGPLPDYPQAWAAEGVHVRLCQTRLSPAPLLAGIKHLNRLEQVLARAEWQDPDIAEGILCDDRGQVIEGTMSNIFLVQGDTLVTPRLDRCGVAGVMRRVVMELQAECGPVEERPVTLADMASAQELFLTNSLIGIWPVRQFQQRVLGAGPLTRRLIASLRTRDDPEEPEVR